MALQPEVSSSLFTAVSTSTRQVVQLLKCISFASKAQLQITENGLRLAVQDSKSMQGLAFLDKKLFSHYNYTGQLRSQSDEDEAELPLFEISLEALLETLQILGFNDGKEKWSARDNAYGAANGSFARGGTITAFDSRVLGAAGVCKFDYEGAGASFRIVIEEAGVTTTCELATYESEPMSDIPIQTDAIEMKIITRASWLHDAINEVSSVNPTRLTMVASPKAPFFSLSGLGPHGSSSVEFSNDPQLLETFQVRTRVTNTYKHAFIKGASRALSMASKVSIRIDIQGVLSLQCMIEVEGGDISFVEFRFVPYVAEEEEAGLSEEDSGL